MSIRQTLIKLNNHKQSCATKDTLDLYNSQKTILKIQNLLQNKFPTDSINKKKFDENGITIPKPFDFSSIKSKTLIQKNIVEKTRTVSKNINIELLQCRVDKKKKYIKECTSHLIKHYPNWENDDFSITDVPYENQTSFSNCFSNLQLSLIKKHRFTLTSDQKKDLKLIIKNNTCSPNQAQIKAIAYHFNIPTTKIDRYFRNQRFTKKVSQKNKRVFLNNGVVLGELKSSYDKEYKTLNLITENQLKSVGSTNSQELSSIMHPIDEKLTQEISTWLSKLPWSLLLKLSYYTTLFSKPEEKLDNLTIKKCDRDVFNKFQDWPYNLEQHLQGEDSYLDSYLFLLTETFNNFFYCHSRFDMHKQMRLITGTCCLKRCILKFPYCIFSLRTELNLFQSKRKLSIKSLILMFSNRVKDKDGNTVLQRTMCNYAFMIFFNVAGTQLKKSTDELNKNLTISPSTTWVQPFKTEKNQGNKKICVPENIIISMNNHTKVNMLPNPGLSQKFGITTLFSYNMPITLPRCGRILLCIV